jgi:hypothetical protein
MKAKTWVGYTLLLILATLIYSYPLMRHLGDSMPYSYMPVPGQETVKQHPGDYIQLFYRFWLFGQAMSGKIGFFSNPYEFSTPGSPPLFTTQGIPLAFIFFFFSSWGNIFAYNMLVLLSFIAAGFSLSLLLYHHTRSAGAAVFFGLLYAVLPYRLGHLYGGHPGAFVFFLTPLSLYFFALGWTKNLEGKRIASFLCGALSGISILSAALLDLHTVFYLVLFLFVYVVFTVIDTALTIPPATALKNSFLPGAGLLLTGALAIGYLVWVKYFFLATSIVGGGRSMDTVRAFSPHLRDLFGKDANAERNIYLGLIPLALGAGGFIHRHIELHRRREKSKLRWLYFWTILFITSYIAALGTALERFIPAYSALHACIPFLKYSRTPSRAMAVAIVCLFILGAYAVQGLLRHKGRGRTAVMLLMFLALLDYHPRRPIGISIMQRIDTVYETVKTEGSGTRLLELPLWPGDSAWSAIYEYYVTLTAVPMINGYNPAVQKNYIEEVFFPLRDLNLGEMRRAQYELLKSWGVRFIVLHQDAFPRKVSRYPFRLTLLNLMQCPFLEHVTSAPPHYLFALRENPGAARQDFFNTNPVGNIYPAPKMKHDTGVLVPDRMAPAGQALLSRSVNGEEKLLWYGHSRIYPTGSFTAFFDLRSSRSPAGRPLARIEAYAPEKKTVVAVQDITSQDFPESSAYHLFPLTFENSVPRRIEFRIHTYGRGKIAADFVYVVFSGEEGTRTSFEAEDLFHIGKSIVDETASGRTAVRIGKNENPHMPMIQGPMRLYRPGRYIARFRLRGDEAGEGTIANLRVDSAFGGIIAGRDITKDMLPANGTYSDYAVPFALKKTTPLTFELHHFNKAHLRLDTVTVTEVNE